MKKSIIGAVVLAAMLAPVASFAQVSVELGRGGLSVEVDRDYESARVQRYNEYVRRHNLEIRACNRYRNEYRRSECNATSERYHERYLRDESNRREEWNRSHNR